MGSILYTTIVVDALLVYAMTRKWKADARAGAHRNTDTWGTEVGP